MTEMTVQHFGNSVLDQRRSFASEGVADGLPHGLRGFPDLYYYKKSDGSQTTTTRWEQTITEELERRLLQTSTVPKSKRYPQSMTIALSSLGVARGTERNYCDIRARLDNGDIWVESKAIFECCIPKKASLKFGRDFSGSTTSKANIELSVTETLIDIRKLELLTQVDGKYIGLLLLGFDRLACPLLKNSAFSGLIKRLESRWHVLHRSWEDAYTPRSQAGFREHAWFFYKAIDGIPT